MNKQLYTKVAFEIESGKATKRQKKITELQESLENKYAKYKRIHADLKTVEADIESTLELIYNLKQNKGLI